MSHRLPASAAQRISDHVDGIIENLISRITKKDEPAKDFDELREAIDATDDDGTGAIYLDPWDWFALIAEVADDIGWTKVEIEVSKLQLWVEEHASTAVIHLAQARAREALDELETFLDDHDFKLSDLRTENRFGWAVHRAEREEDGARVYEYCKIEGEVNVDVYELELSDKHNVYLERHIYT